MSYLKNGTQMSDIEDIDDNTFLNYPRQGSKGYILSNTFQNNDQSMPYSNDENLILLKEKKRIENDTLQSTKNSLAVIYETEKIGLQTAEELFQQREQLNNIDIKLNCINSIMRTSQKHLTSMKSAFGGIKTLFSKNTDTTNSIKELKNSGNKFSSPSSDDKLQQALDRRNLADMPNKSSTNGDRNEKIQNKNLSSYDIHTMDTNQKIENNLNEMGQGINRLKELALSLGKEIDLQNAMLDAITDKSDKAQDTVVNQNRQMGRLLKK